MLPLLDGTRTVEEIDEALGKAAAPAVEKALGVLAERGLLLEGPPLPGTVPAAVADTVHFLAAVGDADEVSDVQDLLRSARVAVLGGGPLANEIEALLGAAGVGQRSRLDWDDSPEPRSLDLAVAAPPPPDLPRLEDWNRIALESDTPWLQVLPYDGRVAIVGPLYVPGETCCHECYRRRREANAGFAGDDFRALERSPASYPSPPPLLHMVAGLAGMLALQWLGDRGRHSAVPATLHALAWNGTAELSRHHVYRVPRCPVCFPDDGGTTSPWHG